MSWPVGYGLHVKMKTTLLRSKPALRGSYEGFFFNKKGGNDK